MVRSGDSSGPALFIFDSEAGLVTSQNPNVPLWTLRFGNGVTGDPFTLLFTAGIDDEAHGRFGAIQAAS